MKKRFGAVLLSLMCVALAASIGWAQQMGQETVPADQAMQWQGQKVMSQDGEELGSVTDLIQTQDAEVSFVLVEAEDQKLHPIPVSKIQSSPGEDQLQAQIDKQTFQDSPGFQDREELAANMEWEQEVRGYYEEGGAMQQPKSE